MKRNELDQLIDDCLESRLSETDAAWLSAEIEKSAEARSRYWEAAMIHGLLDQAMQQSSLRVISGQDAPQGKRRTPWLFASAAAAVLAIGLTWWFMGNEPSSEVPVATVLFTDQCEWQQPENVIEGERLEPQRLVLRKGMAIVRFDGGAEMVIQGNTELELLSATKAGLLRGDVVVRAENDAAGFVLDTPSASLLDLGTEFAVKVDPSQATELHVTEGEVAYAQHGVTTVLPAGKSVRLDASQQAKMIENSAPRFGQLIRQANPQDQPKSIMAYHGFQFDEGSYSPEKISGGKGWAGPWRTRHDQEMRIVHGQQILPWRMNRGTVGMLELPTGQYECRRLMSQPVEMKQRGVTYFSFITHNPSALTEKTSPQQDSLRFTFVSSTDAANSFLSFGYGMDQMPFITAATFGTEHSLSPIPAGQNLLWIGKIIRRPKGDDEVFFRIYGQMEELDFAEPKTWHVNFHRVKMNAALDVLTISSNSTNPHMVDEIRIGTTWRSIVPISLFRKTNP